MVNFHSIVVCLLCPNGTLHFLVTDMFPCEMFLQLYQLSKTERRAEIGTLDPASLSFQKVLIQITSQIQTSQPNAIFILKGLKLQLTVSSWKKFTNAEVHICIRAFFRDGILLLLYMYFGGVDGRRHMSLTVIPLGPTKQGKPYVKGKGGHCCISLLRKLGKTKTMLGFFLVSTKHNMTIKTVSRNKVAHSMTATLSCGRQGWTWGLIQSTLRGKTPLDFWSSGLDL